MQVTIFYQLIRKSVNVVPNVMISRKSCGGIYEALVNIEEEKYIKMK